MGGRIKSETVGASPRNTHRGIPTDYSQMNVTFKPWPSEPARTQNPELGDKYTVAVLQDQILREVAHNLPKNDEETLILMPKTLKDNLTEDFKWQVQKCRSNAKVHFHHWGSGIGTNAYKNCRYAIVVGLFHQNAFGPVSYTHLTLPTICSV